ncbi:hypothetical protein ACLQ2Q_07615 [Microbacterium sp. DT81.1]
MTRQLEIARDRVAALREAGEPLLQDGQFRGELVGQGEGARGRRL